MKKKTAFLPTTTPYSIKKVVFQRPFYTRDVLCYPSGWDLANILLLVWLCVSSIKTGTRRVTCLDELTRGSSARRVTRLVLFFILESNNQTNNYSKTVAYLQNCFHFCRRACHQTWACAWHTHICSPSSRPSTTPYKPKNNKKLSSFNKW